MQLRPYQQAAVEAVYKHLRERDDNPCVVLPTAAGKTPCLATLCKDAVERWDGRVLVVSHVKELLAQAVDKIKLLAPKLSVGVYSAGLKRRDTGHRVIVAGIQSIYKRACELDAFDLIVVDEAHLIPTEGDGMYRQFLADAKVINPHVRAVGLTATPYRMKSGMICGPEYFLNAICYEIGIKELIRDGYLCPLVSKSGVAKADTSGLHIRGGEFIADEVESLMDQDGLVTAACEEIVAQTRNRNAVLIFAASVAHGRHIVEVLEKNHDVECGFVCGETPTNERDELLSRFRGEPSNGLFERKPLKYLCNVNVLTTGFDAPNIDCVVLLRPTNSCGLYYQAVGRGFRLHPDKENCLVLDYGGNVLRHGPVDQIQVRERVAGKGEVPAKECPECNSVIAAGYARCPDCGFEFPPPENVKHDAEASNEGVLSGQVTKTEYNVSEVYYSVHTKRGASEDDPKTLRVDYQVGFRDYNSEWICLEHDGYARQKAVRWWTQRSPDPVPDSAERAVEIAECGGLAMTEKITVRSVSGEQYDRIVAYQLGEMPAAVGIGEERAYADAEEFFDDSLDDIPF